MPATKWLVIPGILSIIANVVFIPAYLTSRPRPGATAYLIRGDLGLASQALKDYAHTHNTHQLQRAALWEEQAAGVAYGYQIHANDGVVGGLGVSLDNLAGALLYHKHFAQAVSVAERLPGLWPLEEAKNQDAASRTALDHQVHTLMQHVPNWMSL